MKRFESIDLGEPLLNSVHVEFNSSVRDNAPANFYVYFYIYSINLKCPSLV